MNTRILEQLYFSKLLEYFPIGKCEDDFYIIHQIGSTYDEEGDAYFKKNTELILNTFKNKTWDQVDFTSLESLDDPYIHPLTTAGMLYYLPAFLHNSYNQLGIFDFEFIHSLALGSFSLSKRRDKKIAFASNEYEYFAENLTTLQSKIVAVYLVNQATLFDNSLAQQALTSYWGNFLLY